MNSDAKQSKVDDDLANRLDTLFDENDTGESERQKRGHSNDPLDELKSLVMSIEWEITDEVMERFLAQIDSLKTRFGEDRILIMFLQLLGSLGLYVKTNKGKAHPNAFKLLNSVYTGFEDAASPGKISPSEKKKRLYIELNKYKELKEQIESTKGPESEPAKLSTAAAAKSDGPKASTAELRQASDINPGDDDISRLTRAHFDQVIGNLKTMILEELAAIRKDVERLKKDK